MWRIEQCTNEPYPRCAHQCATVNDYIYMFGGWTDENQMLNDLHRFNIDTWEWEILRQNIDNTNDKDGANINVNSHINGNGNGNSNGNAHANGNGNSHVNSNGNSKTDEPFIISRNGHSFNAYGKKLVLFGGGSFAGFLNDVVFFDTASMKWQMPASLAGTPPSGRSKHATTVLGSRLYVFGGGDGVRLHNDLYYLDLDSLKWTMVESSRGAVPSPRWGHTMVSIDNHRLLIFGGHSGSKRLNDLHIYDLTTNEWSQPTVGAGSEASVDLYKPQPRAGHSASMVGHYMLVFGGGDGIILNDFVALDVSCWRWWKVTADTPGGRCAHSSSIIKNKLVVFGGGNGLHCIKKMVVFENLDNIDQLYQQYLYQAKLKQDDKNHNIIHNSANTNTPKKIVITPKKLVKPAADETLLSNTIESIAKKVQSNNNNNSNNIIQNQNITSTTSTTSTTQPLKLNDNNNSNHNSNSNINNTEIKDEDLTNLLVTPVDKLKDSCLTDRERRDIKFFLTNIGMAKFVNKFIEEEIDTTVLHLLTEEHLKQLGVTLLGERLTIIKGIRESTLFLFKGLPPIPIDVDPNFSPRIDDDKLDL